VALGGLEAIDGYVAHRGVDPRSRARSIPPGPDVPWGYEPSRFVH